MIQHGTRPSRLDKRDNSFQRTFGGLPVALANQDYTLDIGKTMPDQNADGYPFGCTGYCQADISTTEDGDIYKPSYTYAKTCYIENHPQDQGCDIRNSLKSTQVYGLQRPDETTDIEAEDHRRGQYFNVYCDGGYDWFDSFRSALRTNKRPISVGSIWFGEYEQIGQDGKLPTLFVYDGNPNNYSWHNFAIVGEKIIEGVPYLIAKSWQGRNYGDGGFCYFPRETMNAAMEIRGAVAFTFAKAKPEDINPIKLSIYEVVLLFLYRIIGLTRLA